ncbi:hypothetical protein [Halopiger djelfimassiliensis]|uniref:hypothetical protein n=1 Tax=Halopiger djelfimassiliensis TaxID=1293047 RepID=UPI000677ED2F|nr:hypothetical protein [Halopiger djelfimassiliensis]
MDADVPPEWAIEECRTYTPAETDRELQYRTYRHESGDVRLKVAPASLSGEDHPGYALTTTTYPGLDISETTRVRTVLTFERCDRIAHDFMDLFAGRYDGPGSVEEAVDYASERTRDHR